MKNIFIVFSILLLFILFFSGCDVFTKIDKSDWEESNNEEEEENPVYLYITGATDKFGTNDFLTIKFDYYGKILWEKVIKLGANETGSGIAIDSNENVCVSASLNDDVYTYKFYPNGSMYWITPNSNNFGSPDYTGGISVDIDNNIYVTGSNNLTEITICKSSPDGSSFDINTDSMANYGYDICTDNTGYIYIAGYYYNADNEFYIGKYSPTLTFITNDFLDVDIANNDEALGIIADNSNNIFVTGIVNNDYIYTLKYDSDLNQITNESWPVSENYAVSGIDSPEDITVDNNGNVYITGYTSNNNYDIVTIKYNNSGEKQWERFFGTVSDADYGYGIAVDELGNVFVAGTTNSYNTNFDIIIIKYDSQGNLTWTRPILYDNGANEGAKDIAIVPYR